jgi:hypothetical protein
MSVPAPANSPQPRLQVSPEQQMAVHNYLQKFEKGRGTFKPRFDCIMIGEHGVGKQKLIYSVGITMSLWKL